MMSRSGLGDILTYYPDQFHPLRIEHPDEAVGFSGANVMRVETDAGLFALRGWPQGALSPVRIRGLHRLLAQLFNQGVTQIPVPITARDGTTLVRVQNRDWQLEPWMPGRADFHTDPNDARLVAAVDCLANFHRAAETFAAAKHERPWFSVQAAAPSPAIGERLEKLRRWQQQDCLRLQDALDQTERDEFGELARQLLALFRRVAPPVEEQLAAVAMLKFPLQPCLRDVWHDHLLFTDDEVTGLIDASACRSDHLAIDLSRLLGSLIGDDRQRWHRALETYNRHRPLSPGELTLLQTLDRSSVLLSGMTWLERRYLNGTQFEHPTRVLNRLEHFLGRLQHLADAIA